MSRRTCKLAALALLAATAACAAPYERPMAEFAPSHAPAPTPPVQATGAIYQAGRFASLVEDNRARRVGDVLTIVLVEKTQAAKSVSSASSRNSSMSLTLPDAKPFSWVPDGLLSGGSGQTFGGQGSAAQSNQLTGEMTVTVAQVYTNGTMLVRGQKLIKLNRGEEYLQISGIVRPQDVTPENRVASTRVADARIAYSGTGELAQQTRMGWLQRFFTAITPF
ncbi:flagellar basal body L-ring protein FlgH [Sphingosinicella sp.]|uniref:flagellar basal body L-ring protein FlgH n=1 Tax=Sphingosinicella sp. TaxID=1917971 RepID=UPI00181FA2BA|nr:flagellar basal body L-ring protein FlgH [Sphingosinicella sp.]MBA4756692.1 flagellar basal body L-ring protein FlgH [Sphingosinicella sp.]